MTPDNRYAPHALPGQLDIVAGPGGLPVIEIRNRFATARLCVHGAHVLSFCPKEGADLLFLSEQAVFQPGKAIRGGVPVCWPWFGPDPQGLGRPAHGFVRTRLWDLRRTESLAGGETLVELGLRDSSDTRAIWPHGFDLSLTVIVGRSLFLSLTTRNTGDSAFQLTQALHSYFAVADIAQVRVTGLDGCAYVDKAQGAGGARKVQSGDVGVDAEVDRVYAGVPDVLGIVDAAMPRRIRLTAGGSRTAVVWNPWAEIAAGMADLPDDAYRRFICVETANAGDEVLTLAPGDSRTLVVDMEPPRSAAARVAAPHGD